MKEYLVVISRVVEAVDSSSARVIAEQEIYEEIAAKGYVSDVEVTEMETKG